MKRFVQTVGYALAVHVLALLVFGLFRAVEFVALSGMVTDHEASVVTAFVKGVWFDNVIACYVSILPLAVLAVSAAWGWCRPWLLRSVNVWYGVLLTAGQRLSRKFRPRHIMHKALGRGHTVQRIIVENHQPMVGRELNIQLDAVAVFCGGGKGGQAVLRRTLVLAEITAVGKVTPQKGGTQGIPALAGPDSKQHQQHQNQNKAKQ